MSGSYWGKVIAVGLVVFGLLTISVWWGMTSFSAYQKEHADDYEQIATYQAGTAEQYADGCLKDARDFIAMVKCAITSVDANRETQRSRHDLKAQQEMAEWAFALLLFTAGGFVASLIGIFLVWITFSATREANEIAKENGRAQVSAYVYISEAVLICKYELSLHKIGRDVCALIEFKNFGQSPARNVSFFIEKIGFFVSDESKVGFGEQLIVTHHEIENIAPSHTKMLRTEVQNISPLVHPELVSGERAIYVWGRITYEDVFDRKWELGFRRRATTLPKNSTELNTYVIPKDESCIERLSVCAKGNHSKQIT
jgi:hypothetical protein